MPTLTSLQNGTSDPTLVSLANSNPVVEPLDGPTSVDQVFDRFPEEVYQQGKDSHLYRLLAALGGDAGAGFIKAQVYAERLQWEAEFLNTTALDSFYGYQFTFPRLKSETYAGLDPNSDALTPPSWDQIELADQAYRQRIAEFWTATREGNTPDGMQVAAQSGIGVECEIVEHYKWVFDQFSDDKLGLTPLGTTVSTGEFVVVPRFKNLANAANFEYTQNYPTAYAFTPASLPNARPALGGTGPSVTVSVSTTSDTALQPQLERNMIDILDRLKSVGTLASVNPDQTRYLDVPVNAIHGSSERVHANRLVTGQTSITWPPVDPSQGYFIEEGVENEATYYQHSARELPIVFLTIEGIHSYTEAALGDSTYNTSAFFNGVISAGGVTTYPYITYASEFVGFYSAPIQALFPFLNGVSPNVSYLATNAPAIQETPLMLESSIS